MKRIRVPNPVEILFLLGTIAREGGQLVWVAFLRFTSGLLITLSHIIQFIGICIGSCIYVLLIFLYQIRLLLIGFFVCFIIFTGYYIYDFVYTLPSPQNIGKVNYKMTSYLYDRNDILLHEMYSEQNRRPIPLKEIPLHVIQATIAIEDKDFYKHNGVSIFSGVLRAGAEIVIHKQIQGGSTITQQLVKNALLTSQRTLMRKIREAILALWVERVYSKSQILEMYFNQIPYGGQSYGVNQATETYFGKQVKNLTISEGALLAGLISAPTLYSPYTNKIDSLMRRNIVLKKMVEQKYITKAQYNEALQEELVIRDPQTIIKAPHFVYYVKSQLEQVYGTRIVEEGGLKVATTLDFTLQEKIEEIVRNESSELDRLEIGNVGVLVTKPSTGAILAMVVGKGDYNLTTALRQPGSSIKPLLYALAFTKGYTDSTTIVDEPITFYSTSGFNYTPKNYDGAFHGTVTLRTALANSYNIPPVKLLDTLGVDAFVEFSKKMGISTWNNPSQHNLTLALGGAETTMIDMARAYGVLANNGNQSDISYYSAIEQGFDKKIIVRQPSSQRMIPENVAHTISDILSDNEARRSTFGPQSVLEIPRYKVAVKTGTTDQIKDNWTIGYTPNYLVIVRVGNNDGSPMNSGLVSGISGAAPLWNKIMQLLINEKSYEWYK